MKKVLICFLVTCILSSSAFTEVLKAPLLISHYIDHAARNPMIGFIDFLSMHYWGRDIADHDHVQDMKLPFKKVAHSHSQIVFYPTEILTVLKNSRFSLSKSQFFYCSKTLTPIAVKLLRPPQFLPTFKVIV